MMGTDVGGLHSCATNREGVSELVSERRYI